MSYKYMLFEFVDGFMQLRDLRQVQWCLGNLQRAGVK